jgi:hypothetical protein
LTTAIIENTVYQSASTPAARLEDNVVEGNTYESTLGPAIATIFYGRHRPSAPP